MNIRQLEFFEATARLGSMRAASSQLGIGQPAMSAQIRALERELRLELFRREGRGLRLTVEGEEILRQTRSILIAISDLKLNADEMHDISQGTLRLGMIPYCATEFFPSIVDRFRHSHPQLKVLAREGGSVELVRRVQAAELDGVLVSRTEDFPEVGPELEVIEIVRSQLLALVASGDPLESAGQASVSQVAARHLVLYGEDYLMHHVAQSLLGDRITKNNSIYMGGNTESTKEMVRRGLGVAVASGFVRKFAAREQFRGIAFIDMPDARVETILCYIYRKDRWRPRQIQSQIVETLRESLA